MRRPFVALFFTLGGLNGWLRVDAITPIGGATDFARHLPFLSVALVHSDARWIEDTDTRRQGKRTEAAEVLMRADSGWGGPREFPQRARKRALLTESSTGSHSTALFFSFFFLSSRVSPSLSFLFLLLNLGRVRREAQAPPRALQRHADAREALHPLHG